jgi:hypothetical protein
MPPNKFRTMDVKEQTRIYDVERLSDIMREIDKTAYKVRAEALNGGNVQSLLAEYLAKLEVLWINLLRAHALDTDRDRIDKEIEALIDTSTLTLPELVKALKLLNKELYLQKEQTPSFSIMLEKPFTDGGVFTAEELDELLKEDNEDANDIPATN